MNNKPEFYLHIHAQRFQHDDAYIIGTRESLICLKELIDRALNGSSDFKDFTCSENFFASDGESYPMNVTRVENLDDDEPTHYTDYL